MESADELAETICQLNRVSADEAERIWQKFFPRLMRFAKTRITHLRTGAFDEEDIALSAIKSFFRCMEAGKYQAIEGDDELWRLLVTITSRKITAQLRRQMAAKRANEHTESVFGDADGAHDSFAPGLAQVMDKRNLPESTSAVINACEEMLGLLTNEMVKRTAIMRLEGYSNQEIAAELQCSVARVKQRVAKAKQVWNLQYV